MGGLEEGGRFPDLEVEEDEADEEDGGLDKKGCTPGW